MIYDSQTLKNAYNMYSNINQKISLDTKNGKLIRIRRGLYSDNLKVDAPVIANICNNPSYISFEYALSFYGLIPEHVSTITSTLYGKKNNYIYNESNITFEYKSIPDDVFYYGITYEQNDANIKYKIATKEKALCDMLYIKYPVRSIKDLKILLFEDLRIDEEEFKKLDYNFIEEIAPLYHSNSLNTLSKYIKEISKNGFDN